MTTDEMMIGILAIVARTVLRIERHLLTIDKGKTEKRVMAHNDECIRFRGLMEDGQHA